MAGLPQHSCMVPGCAEVLLGLRGRPLQACSLHRSAVEVDIDGDPFRYCVACATLHPIKEFPQSSHLCKAKQQHYWPDFGRRRRLMRQRAKLAFTALQGGLVFFCSAVKACASVLGKALAVYTSPSNGNRDHGQEVYGLAAITFLGGQAPAARVALPILYSVACHTMGPRRAETLVSIALSSFFLHILLPYVHHYHYALPLLETRRVAAQLGLALSSSFEVLDHSSLRKYEWFIHDSIGSGYVASVGRMVGVLSIAALRSMQALEATVKVWGVPRGWLLQPCLLLVGLVYLPARLRALGLQRHRWSQWLDAALLVLANTVSPLPMAYAWASGAHSCGTPDLFSVGSEVDLAVLCLTGMIASLVILSALLDGPVSMVAAVTAAVTLLNALTVLISQWCIKLDVGATVSSVTMVILVGAWLAGGIVCLALKVRQEKFRLLRYMQQLTEAAKALEPLDSDVLFEGNSYLLLALKVGDVTPADLPINLRWRVLSTMQVVPQSLTGSIWPGCVLLGLEMRFSSPAEMLSARMSFLSQSDLSETLFDSTVSAIGVAIQGSVYTMRDGQLQRQLPVVQGPSIASVEPLAPSPACTALTLQLSRLGDMSFTVMLRCGGHYRELEVVGTRPADAPGRSVAVVRLPEAAQLHGLAWVEVLLDSPDGSLMMSEASPMLFTSVPEVAEELSRALPACCRDDSQAAVAGMLGDLARCLQGEAASPPGLLLQVATMGMSECFKHIATSAATLSSAEQQGQGLLGSAAISGSLEMLDLVISTLVAFRLPVNPCQRAPDSRGYTALHWAADAGHLDLVYALLAEAPNPLQSWRGCRARLSGKTPAQLMAEAGLDGCVDEQTLAEEGKEDRNACRAGHSAEDPDTVLGSSVVAALRARTTTSRLFYLAVYAAVVMLRGWRDPLTWATLALAFATLHLMLPYVHQEVYVKGLEEARTLAARCGLRVSECFCLANAPHEQKMYERHASRRARSGLVGDTVAGVLLVLLFTAPTGELLSALISRGAGLAPAALGCIGVAVRAWAMCTAQHTLWQWMGTALEYYVRLTYTLPAIYSIITGHNVLPNYPSELVLQIAPNSLLAIAMNIAGFAFWLVLAVVQKQPVGGRLAVRSELCFLAAYCLVFTPAVSYHIGGVEWCVGIILISSVAHTAHRLALLGHRLRCEKRDLCAFLSAQTQKSE